MATSQGLGEILPSMASSISELMRNLYDVERALINAQGEILSPQEIQFGEVRKDLKNYWEKIAAILKKFHAFARAVVEMWRISRNCEARILLQLSAELLEKCKVCRSFAKALFDERNDPLESYSNHKAGFKDILHSSKITGKWRDKKSRPRLNGLNFDSTEGNNGLPHRVIDNPQPDGEEAMDNFDKAYEVFQKGMEGLVTFFDGQVEACEKYQDVLDGRAKNISWDEIEQFATKWEANRAMIARTIKEILQVCDAIMIPAPVTVGPPLFPINSTESTCQSTSVTTENCSNAPLVVLHNMNSAPILGRVEPPGILANFERLTKDSIKTQQLVQDTRVGFDIIALWTKISSDIGVVSDLANQMRGQSINFLQSIHLSYNNADSGFSFAKTAELLCTALPKPEAGFATSSVLHYIEEMRDIAQMAHREATSTAQSFQDNRRSLSAITGAIPGAIQSVITEKAKVKTNKGRAEKQAEKWENEADQLASKPVWHPGRLVGVFRRPGSKAKAFQAEAKDRTSQLQRYDEAIDYLQLAVERHKTLMVQIHSIADYWLEMDSILGDMHERVNEIRADDLLQLKLEGLQSDWRKVASGYMVYKKGWLNQLFASLPLSAD